MLSRKTRDREFLEMVWEFLFAFLMAVISLVFMAFVVYRASAHSGGFDDYGCHTNHASGDYHCHHSEAVAHYYLQKYAGEDIWYRGQVLSVHDGDTFRMRAQIWLDHMVEVNVRINGIDTAELNHRAKCPAEEKQGKIAKQQLQKLLGGEVILHKVSYDKFGGRVLADVYTTDFQNVGLLLVHQGYARFYDGRGKRDGWCK
jgi:endonuclease YncB( thermonuclease family)